MKEIYIGTDWDNNKMKVVYCEEEKSYSLDDIKIIIEKIKNSEQVDTIDRLMVCHLFELKAIEFMDSVQFFHDAVTRGKEIK